MTRQEMIEKYSLVGADNNYEEAQRRIKEAMLKGESYVLLPKEEFSHEFSWWATSDTIERLVKDGFDLNEVWQPAEYWSIEWYD